MRDAAAVLLLFPSVAFYLCLYVQYSRRNTVTGCEGAGWTRHFSRCIDFPFQPRAKESGEVVVLRLLRTSQSGTCTFCSLKAHRAL